MSLAATRIAVPVLRTGKFAPGEMRAALSIAQIPECTIREWENVVRRRAGLTGTEEARGAAYRKRLRDQERERLRFADGAVKGLNRTAFGYRPGVLARAATRLSKLMAWRRKRNSARAARKRNRR